MEWVPSDRVDSHVVGLQGMLLIMEWTAMLGAYRECY